MIREMVKRQENMKIPTELLPACPYCGKPLTMNLRADDKFVEDEGWHRAAERYENFLRTRNGQKVFFPGTGRRIQYPGHHQIPLLADDSQEPGRNLCLHQSGTGNLPAGNRAAVHLYQCRSWYSSSQYNVQRKYIKIRTAVNKEKLKQSAACRKSSGRRH